MDPDFYLANWRLGWALLEKGQNQEAIMQIEKAARMPEAAEWVRSALATAYAKTGQIDKARKILGKMKNESRQNVDLGYDIAYVNAALGDKDQAFWWLNKAFQTRSGSLILLKVDPGMDSLRPDPRFRDLMHRVGLTP
jgi:pentatricopeptide repeat protein